MKVYVANAEFMALVGKGSSRKSRAAMRAEGKAFSLTDEEITMLESFRRFKLRMRKDGEVFTFQTRRPEGVQIVEETAEIIHPSETLDSHI